jgi:hypothetical protein
MRKKKIYITLIVFAVLTLTLVSCYTTFAIGDGGFPSAKFNIKVQNEAGDSIEGAMLTVYRRTGWFGIRRKISYEYPIQEFSRDSKSFSKSDGVIRVSHISKGMEFGGPVFALFWLFPIHIGVPDIEVVIEASKYKPIEFDYTDLYLNCDREPELFDKNTPNCSYGIMLEREV